MLEMALVQMAMERAQQWGFTPMVPPALVKPRAMEGTGFLGQAADDVYHLPADDLYLVGTSEVPLAAYHSDEILDVVVAAAPLRRVQPVLPPRGRLVRQGHHAASSGCTGSTRSRCSSTPRSRSRTPRTSGCSHYERQWLLDLELPFRVIDVAAGDLGLSAIRKFDCEAWVPTQERYREVTSTSNCTQFQARRLDIRLRDGDGRDRARGHPQRHAVRGPAHDHRAAREPPAGRRLRTRAAGAAALPAGTGRAQARRVRRVTPAAPTGWRPRLVALDVDGTLVDWVDGGRVGVGAGARRRAAGAVDAGAHVVISTGRSVPGVLDAVGPARPRRAASPSASNGAVTFSYPPVEMLDVVTFDARETVKLLLEEVPDAHVAVEEIGRGYRINKAFPEGEISGEMVVQSVEELVAEPVTRVIIRSPDQSVEDFAELAQRLGLHGINYYVGYTAWLDLAPQGVSKATGLESVARRLGVAQADVLALGDGHNDVEMLQWAGRGVAMGQSPPSVQEPPTTSPSRSRPTGWPTSWPAGSDPSPGRRSAAGLHHVVERVQHLVDRGHAGDRGAGRSAVCAAAGGLAPGPAQMPLHRGQRALQPVRQHLQRVVGIGRAGGQHRLVVDRSPLAAYAGGGVQVLALGCRAEPVADLLPLGRGRAADEASDVALHHRGVQALGEQRAGRAGGAGPGDEVVELAAYVGRSGGRVGTLLEQRVQVQRGVGGAGGARRVVR